MLTCEVSVNHFFSVSEAIPSLKWRIAAKNIGPRCDLVRGRNQHPVYGGHCYVQLDEAAITNTAKKTRKIKYDTNQPASWLAD